MSMGTLPGTIAFLPLLCAMCGITQMLHNYEDLHGCNRKITNILHAVPKITQEYSSGGIVMLAPNQSDRAVQLGNLTIDLSRFEARVEKAEITLTKTEMYLLWTLVANEGRTFSREELIEAVWDSGLRVDPRTVDTHIGRLRKKLRAYTPNPTIRTVWHVGYKAKLTTESQTK